MPAIWETMGCSAQLVMSVKEGSRRRSGNEYRNRFVAKVKSLEVVVA